MGRVLKERMRQIGMGEIDEPSGVVRIEIDMERVQELAENIAEVGLLQPIIVRPSGDRYEIVAGHRRFLAFRYLERKKIMCIVREYGDMDCAVARATENIRRVGVSPIEEAASYADLRDNYGLRVDEISKVMGKSSGVIKRRLDLLKMPPQLQKAVHEKKISYSVAEELWSLGDEGAINYYLGFAVDHGATQAVVRGWVKEWKDVKRREESGAGGGGEVRSPLEPRPVYVACDLCLGAMEIGREEVLRVCERCSQAIRDAVGGKKG